MVSAMLTSRIAHNIDHVSVPLEGALKGLKMLYFLA